MFGFPELIIVGMLLLVTVVAVGAVLVFGVIARTRAGRLGYVSTRAYLKAAPRSDAEKRDAADLALKGVVICVLGLLFPPFVLAGLIPLFYGGRKLAYASMGLGLVDDSVSPRA